MVEIKQSQKDTTSFFHSVFEQQFESVFPQKTANEEIKSVVFVIEEDEVLIAAVSCQILYETLKISNLAVHSQYRRLGFGRKMLDFLKDYSQNQGVTNIILTTRSYQAKDFYLKNEFKIFGQLDDCPFDGVSTYYMVYRT